METINVIAISTKKVKGWLRCAAISGTGVWADVGMRFDKVKFESVFVAPGLYSVEYVNNGMLGSTDLEVVKAEKIKTFIEIVSEKM